MQSLTRKEYQVVSLMWAEHRALSAKEILALLPDKTWKDSTIHLLLNGLLDKEAIYVERFAQCGRTYARLFNASYSMEEYFSSQIKQDRCYSAEKNEKLVNLISDLLADDELTAETLGRIEALAQDRKRELKK